jgi:hypothetical protein
VLQVSSNTSRTEGISLDSSAQSLPIPAETMIGTGDALLD